MEELLEEAETKYEEALEYAVKLSSGLEAHPDTSYESSFQSTDLPMTEDKARFESEVYIQLYSVLLPQSAAKSQRLMYDASHEIYPSDSSDEPKPELVKRKEKLEEKHDTLLEDFLEDLASATKEATGKNLFNARTTLEPVNDYRKIAAD